MVASASIRIVRRPLETDHKAVGIFQPDLLHSIVGDGRLLGLYAMSAKMGMNGVQIATAEKDRCIGVGDIASLVRGRRSGVRLIGRVKHQLDAIEFQPSPVKIVLISRRRCRVVHGG